MVLNCFGSFHSKLLRATVCHKLKSQFVLDTLHGRKFVAMQRTQTNQTGHILTPLKTLLPQPGLVHKPSLTAPRSFLCYTDILITQVIAEANH